MSVRSRVSPQHLTNHRHSHTDNQEREKGSENEALRGCHVMYPPR
jgi:hypothetical protein